MNSVTHVYALCDPSSFIAGGLSCDVRYIGKTDKQPDERLSIHLKEAREGNRRHVYCWIRTLFRARLLPRLRVLKIVPQALGAEAEIDAIRLFRLAGSRLTNLTDGGDGISGLKMSPEARAKMAEAKRGKRQSPEHIAAKSVATKKTWQDPEMRRRRIRGMCGRVVTKATRAKISAAHTGMRCPDERRRRISLALMGRRQGPESQIKRSRSLKKAWANDPTRRLKMSARMKARYADLKERKRESERMRLVWKGRQKAVIA